MHLNSTPILRLRNLVKLSTDVRWNVDGRCPSFDSSPFSQRATSPGGKFSAAIWSANSKVCRASQDEDGMLLCSCSCTQTFGLDMSFTWAGNDCYHDHFKLKLKNLITIIISGFCRVSPTGANYAI